MTTIKITWAGTLPLMLTAIEAGGTARSAAERDLRDMARVADLAAELAETLQYVLDADAYDGALTTGSASLSPAIRNRIERALAEANAAKGGN